MRVAHRIQQLSAALTARVTSDEHELVARILSPAELRLFLRMPLFDQRHSLDVYHTLVRAGHQQPALLKAALLHDCGKVDDDGRPLPLLYYGMFVVLRRLAPGLYQRAVRNGHGLLRPFTVHAEHDMRSVRLVEAAAGDATTTKVLRDYAVHDLTSLAGLLSWADNQN